MAAKARILAIDDQLYFRSFLEGLLAEEGFEVRSVRGGPQGLSLLERDGPFDLVIMDLVAAASDGVEMVARFRERDRPPEIIVVTGVGDVRSVVSAMRHGASDYLLKPIDRESLLRSVETVLSRRRIRDENARLVDENLEVMGRLSLIERALPLFAITDLSTAARDVLELLCVELGQPDAALWVREACGSTLQLQATQGDISRGGDTVSWKTADEALDAAVRRGESVRLTPSRGPGPSAAALLLPLVLDGELVAVARLSGAGGAPPEGGVEACQKLAGVVIANALRVAELGTTSLRDPDTGLTTRAYLEEMLQTEIHKAHRFSRRLSCLCVAIRGLSLDADAAQLQTAIGAMTRTLRTTDVLSSEGARRFWVLVTDTDSLGGVVLKRRLADCLNEALRNSAPGLSMSLAVASYPLDGETAAELIETALERVETERDSLIHELQLPARASLADLSRRLLERAEPLPRQFVAEAAELLIGELTCRPRDRGLLFMAPGPDAGALIGPLSALGDTEIATDVFIATDGDTVPAGPAVTGVALPQNVSPDTSWIVRFGEAPPYALVAGSAGRDGTRPVFHSADRVLVEHMTFQLRSEVGFGVRG